MGFDHERQHLRMNSPSPLEIGSRSLTTRAIRGEMRILNEEGSSKYFDQVYVTSHLGRKSF